MPRFVDLVTECCDKLAAAHLARGPGIHIQTRDTEWDMKERQSKHDATLKMKSDLIAFFYFAQKCTIKILPPKVKRNGRVTEGSYACKNRFVKPDILLKWSGREIHLSKRDEFELVEKYVKSTNYGAPLGAPENEWAERPNLPNLMQEFGVYRHQLVTDFTNILPDIVAAFEAEVPGWPAIREQALAHIAEVEGSLEQIVRNFVDKSGKSERSAFRKKLSDCLVKTRGLIDAPPEAVTAIFKLGHAEIDTLMRFAKRAKADTDIVTVEDIEEAQNDARVRSVMES